VALITDCFFLALRSWPEVGDITRITYSPVVPSRMLKLQLVVVVVRMFEVRVSVRLNVGDSVESLGYA
jgi:hypothetical protein